MKTLLALFACFSLSCAWGQSFNQAGMVAVPGTIQAPCKGVPTGVLSQGSLIIAMDTEANLYFNVVSSGPVAKGFIAKQEFKNVYSAINKAHGVMLDIKRELPDGVLEIGRFLREAPTGGQTGIVVRVISEPNQTAKKLWLLISGYDTGHQCVMILTQKDVKQLLANLQAAPETYKKAVAKLSGNGAKPQLDRRGLDRTKGVQGSKGVQGARGL